jgi:hypothetical protein
VNDKLQEAINALRAAGDEAGAKAVEELRVAMDRTMMEYHAGQRASYGSGRKDEREQWEPVARLALAALNSCDGEDGYKGPQQWFNNEQVSDAIKKLCALICPVCLGAGWTADRVGEACPCGLYSWEARK